MLKAIKRGKYYHASGLIEGRQYRKSLGITSKRIAEIKVAEMNGEIERGIAGFVLEQKRLDDFWTEFKACIPGRMAPRSAERYAVIYKYFKDFLTSREKDNPLLSHITQADVQAYITYRSLQGAKPNTIHVELNLLRAFFYDAMRKKYMTKNPAAGVIRPKIYDKIVRVYTPEQVNMIFEYCLENEEFRGYYRVFLTLYYTGMRYGELQFLEWDDIDLDNRIIRVHGKENWNPKTTVARGLPMNDVLYQELFIQSISKKSRWVFCDEKGEQIKEVNTLRVLKHVVSELKISYGTLHMFRHSTATHMLKAGVSLKDVKEFLGHKDIETTEQYLHLLPNSLHDAAQKLQEICTKFAQSDTTEQKNSSKSIENKEHFLEKITCGDGGS